MEFRTLQNADVRLRVALEGEGPVILCVHGWPELWYSWRHQLAHFSSRGYTLAAMDVRGYGGSSKPSEIAAYSMIELAGDVAAVARQLSETPVVLFGHDWGAPIVYNTALLHPDAVRAVAGLSVPYMPPSAVSVIDLLNEVYKDRFFYQVYFQEPGVVEAELEADVRRALRKIYYALSGDAPQDKWLEEKPRDARLLDGMEDPDPFPAWLSDADMQVYVEAFEAGGFRGPINRYRAQRLDAEQLAAVHGKSLAQPTCFIGGEKDAVRHFIPGGDLYADPGATCEDFRGSTIVPGAGHWVQQEAPEATNQALEHFLRDL
jgi:pimeloyl-ACP methyl ester carboxylesterase